MLAGGLLTAVSSRPGDPADTGTRHHAASDVVRSLAAAGAAGDTPVDLATTVPETSAPAPPPPVAPTPAPAPPVAAPPATAPPVTAPPQAPATPPPPPESPAQRVHRAYAAGVPAPWHAILPARLEVIPGSTSWARGDDTILIAQSHAAASFEHLVDVVAHEYGHLIAFRYGSGAYPGAAPTGWPSTSDRPEEAWADCVQTAFTGRENPSHGLQPCRGESLSWARSWLHQFPAS